MYFILCRVLCENGCNLNARTLRGETALHVAVSQMEFNTEMINLLLSSGCNADIQDNLGRQTALHVFIRKHVVSASSSSSSSSSSSWSSNGEVQEVFQTLAKATNVNIADRRLRTPLHFIASCKKSNIKLLQVILIFFIRLQVCKRMIIVNNLGSYVKCARYHSIYFSSVIVSFITEELFAVLIRPQGVLTKIKKKKERVTYLETSVYLREIIQLPIINLFNAYG